MSVAVGIAQNGLIEPAQCALVDFTTDLHADDQEEDRHQRVVDPEMQRSDEDELAKAKRNRQVPDVVIRMGERRVGPEQCGSCGHQQHDATDSLDMQELLERRERPFDEERGFGQVPAGRLIVHGRTHPAWRPDHRLTCRCPNAASTRGCSTERWD
jgi:hypothetical protein